MEVIEKYKKIVNESFAIAEKFLNEQSKNSILKEQKNLIDSFDRNAFIKVPFVGDFNAGKSSMLNSFIDRDILPTNITPETSVSYEIFYSENEYFEVLKNGAVIERKNVEEISNFKPTPDVLIRLYINNQKIKDLNDRGVVLVDMPGIDSGIEAHNNAIMNYVQDGTYFVIANDVKNGTLKSSTVAFIEEIKKYALSAAIVVTKKDCKPESEQEKTRNYIKEQASRLLNTDVTVEMISALDKDLKGLEIILEKLNGTELAKTKFNSKVTAFVSRLIGELELQSALLKSDTSTFDSKIAELQAKLDGANAELEDADKKAQTSGESVQDILNDISNALFNNSNSLAMSIYSKADSNTLCNQVVSIVRPTIVNSFKREVGEYQEIIGSALKGFSKDLESIINDSNNPLLKNVEGIVGNIVGRELLEELLTKGLNQVLAKVAGYKSLTLLASSLGKVINPLVGILINFIPDILRLIFGKSKEQKISQIQEQLQAQAFGQIVDALRAPLEGMLIQERQDSLEAVKALITERITAIQENIKNVKKEKEEKAAQLASKEQAISAAITSLNTIKQNI